MTMDQTVRLPALALAGFVLLGAAVLFVGAPKALANGEPTTVESVDLTRYAGTWYEIASFPQSFQRDCVATQADYVLRANGKVGVTNRCRLKTLDGEWKVARGVARSVDPSNAKLKVSFFWPFEGDYWVFELGDDYEYAVVGSPDRDSLWILSRTRQLPQATIDMLLSRIELQLGFDVSRLRYTLQPEG